MTFFRVGLENFILKDKVFSLLKTMCYSKLEFKTSDYECRITY